MARRAVIRGYNDIDDEVKREGSRKVGFSLYSLLFLGQRGPCLLNIALAIQDERHQLSKLAYSTYFPVVYLEVYTSIYYHYI